MQEESRNFKTILIVSSKSYKMVLHSQSKARMLEKVNYQSTRMGLGVLKIYENLPNQ